MQYFTYDNTTGVIQGIGSLSIAPVDRAAYDSPEDYQSAVQSAIASALAHKTKNGKTARLGAPDPKSQKWDIANEELVAYTPPAASIDYASENRKRRDARLRKSDWTQLPDSPLTSTKKTEWATYRQELRDLPEDLDDFDTAFVSGSDWPTKPS